MSSARLCSLRFWLAAIAIFLGLARGVCAITPTAGWQQWDGCTQVVDHYFDGDSFQIRHAGKIYITRLYSADAPETDAGLGTRITEQAAYFGVSEAEVLRAGERAKDFTARFLSKPFRVITRLKIAPGASRSERYYAMIQNSAGVSLDAALIQAGLARPTTETAEYPDAAGGRKHLLELRALEQKAARERKGLWTSSKRADKQESLDDALKPRGLAATGGMQPAPLRKVNINTAPASDLDALPGFGPKTVQEVIRARPIKDIDALDALPGFGPKKIAAIRDLITF